MDGTAHQCVQTYLQQQTGLDSFQRVAAPGVNAAILAGKIVADGGGENVQMLVKLKIWSDASRKVSLDLRLSESTGNPVGFGSLGTLDGNQMINLHMGINDVHFSFSTRQIANGSYAVGLDITFPFREFLDRVERCLSFEVARPAMAAGMHVTSQNWGYGSMQIPLTPLCV